MFSSVLQQTGVFCVKRLVTHRIALSSPNVLAQYFWPDKGSYDRKNSYKGSENSLHSIQRRATPIDLLIADRKTPGAALIASWAAIFASAVDAVTTPSLASQRLSKPN